MSLDATIAGVRVADGPDGPVPVVVLAVDGGDDVLPIFVDVDQAVAIARGLDAVPAERPRTHDLLLDVVEALGGRVAGVDVSGTDGGTYLADLRVATPRGETTVDARPSDSLALAARTGAPITVAERVFEGGREAGAAFDGLPDVREVTAL